MRSSPLRRRIGAGVIAFGAMAGIIATASPSGAQQPPEILTIVGSDTTDQMMGAISSQGAGQYNIRAQQTTPVTVPGDANCSSSFTYRTPAVSPEVLAPNGSSAGRNALRQAMTNATGSFPSPGGFGQGCVDIARSSSEPRAVDANNDRASFEYYAFAIDALQWASPSLQAPATITLQQARDIWTCTITRWEQLPGGGSGQIQRVRPQSSSGTFQSFTNNLLAGVTIAPASADCPAPIDTQENTGKDPAFTTNVQLREQAFMAYSLANWSFQGNNSANPTLDVRNGVRPLGIVYAGPPREARYAVVISAGGRFVLNTAFVNINNPNFTNQADHTQLPGIRRVYNVIDSQSPSYLAARNFVGFDNAGTAKSPLCNGAHSSIIRDQGYQPIAAHTEGVNPNVTCIRRTPT